MLDLHEPAGQAGLQLACLLLMPSAPTLLGMYSMCVCTYIHIQGHCPGPWKSTYARKEVQCRATTVPLLPCEIGGHLEQQQRGQDHTARWELCVSQRPTNQRG